MQRGDRFMRRPHPRKPWAAAVLDAIPNHVKRFVKNLQAPSAVGRRQRGT